MLEQEIEQTAKDKKKAKFVNSALAWGLIVGELIVVVTIALIVLLPVV